MLVDGLIARFGSWLGEEGAVVRVLDPRRFPAPWTVEKKVCALLCTTTNGHPWRISATKRLIPHRANCIAPDLAKLPELLRMA
jgi:hypothetical protein